MTIESDTDWNYFQNDHFYSDQLRSRLSSGLEMESAKAMAYYIGQFCSGDLDILDFGAGPGHYYPVIVNNYKGGAIKYNGVDIDSKNIEFGNEFFKTDTRIKLKYGSVLEPDSCYTSENCIISANTLPHIPSILPLCRFLASEKAAGVQYFIARMLVGTECVQIKKHLSQYDYNEMYVRNYQYNNIYSMEYLRHLLGDGWKLFLEDDIFDMHTINQHSESIDTHDPFYTNRVSRTRAGMIFKGEVYMPWKFLVGTRWNRA
jgi:hypothetical protein